MMKYEDPTAFDINKRAEGVEVIYSNLIEICQGGPETGELHVNGNLIASHFFGGPCLINEGFVFAPAYFRKFFGSYFRLVKIDVDSLDLKFLGEPKDLIYLDKIENGMAYFWEDVTRKSYLSIRIV